MAILSKSRTARPMIRPRPRPRPTTINPRDSWPAWTDGVRFSPAEAEVDGVVADHVEPDTGPTRLDDAYATGFMLGIEGEDAAPPEHFGDLEAFLFRCGRTEGWRKSRAGQAWYQSVAQIDAGRTPITLDPCEVAEHCGIDVARSMP